MLTTQQFAYKSIPEGDDLLVYVFKDGAEEAGPPRKGILFFHGGGWNGGSPELLFPQCKELAARGWVAMSAGYRIRSLHGTPPTKSVEDARSCVRWVIAHAGELGFDPATLVLGGGSAGGHLALASLLTAAFDSPDDDESVRPQARALVLFNPVADAGPEGYGYEQIKDCLNEFSPLHAIKEALPPILIQTGLDDTTTPVSGMRAFRDKCVALGGQCELIEYEGQVHAFFNYRDGNNPYYEKTVAEMIRFLDAL